MYAWGVLSESLPGLVADSRALYLDGIGLAVFAAVFGLAGIAKLRRPQFAAVSLSDFGVTRRVQVWHGTALGADELGFAAALLIAPWPYVALAATGVVMWVFTVALALRVHAGHTTPCFCFGTSAEPTSVRTVARTAGLASVATLLVVLASDIRSFDPMLLAVQFVAASALVFGVLLFRSLRTLTAKAQMPLGEGSP